MEDPHFIAQTLSIEPDGERFFMKDSLTGETVPRAIPYREFFALYQLIKAAGRDDAHNAATYLASVALDREPTVEEAVRLRTVLEAVHYYIYTDKAPDKETTALEITYTLLRSKAITHKGAAELASDLVGKHFEPNTWRMRIDRWAEKHGRPKVEQRKRSTNKQASGLLRTNSE